ncbi:M15 family metallopeptidase [Microbacterium resistens]|uniref:M15 family metallopeptidase n=1 Tax=Microbacterium resistens TaxID=156977 RepID=A0ABY3RRQ2_9MICO|nr:M15 family metallopeptidase [Microbacterium resistens]UGS25549.1 M15 family metallopeptidase [Microbacterium resistens]
MNTITEHRPPAAVVRRGPSRAVRQRRALAVVVGVAAIAAAGVLAVTAVQQAGSANALVQGPTAGTGSAGTGPAAAEADGQADGGMPDASDGYIADGETISLYDGAPAVSGLDPALREALLAAAAAASDDGVELRVASGWRSPRYQSWLLERAVQQYGSAEEAGRWVGTPETSLHVKGQAVDIGPFDSSDWLDRKGDAFGLCRTYENETWHFELFPEAVDQGCPQMYADAAEDPRMQR